MMSSGESNLDHPFWRYSLAVYSKEGVPAELVALQDRFDIDVNIALFCLWLGHAVGFRISRESLDSIIAHCATWNAETVVPLRAVRRHLKVGAADLPIADAAQALRSQVKRSELLAEQIEQSLLYGWFNDQNSPGGTGLRGIAEENLTLFMQKFVSGWNEGKTAEAYARTLAAADQAGG